MIFILSIGSNGYSLWLHHGKMKVDEKRFARDVLSDVSVPNLTLTQAQNRGCAWIVEVEPFSFHPTQPTRSHFNLLNPMEVDSLLLEYGCIDWCYTMQDWAWTELGVQDRALRIEQMFEWTPTAIVRAGEIECILRTMQVDTSMDLEHKHIH